MKKPSKEYIKQEYVAWIEKELKKTNDLRLKFEKALLLANAGFFKTEISTFKSELYSGEKDQWCVEITPKGDFGREQYKVSDTLFIYKRTGKNKYPTKRSVV